MGGSHIREWFLFVSMNTFVWFTSCMVGSQNQKSCSNVWPPILQPLPNDYHDQGKKYLQLHSDFLFDQIQVIPDQEKGFRYLQAAAENGDNYSNYWIARAYHIGNGLPEGNEIDFGKAIKHYLNINEEISNFDIPFYSILGKPNFRKYQRNLLIRFFLFSYNKILIFKMFTYCLILTFLKSITSSMNSKLSIFFRISVLRNFGIHK